MALTDIDGARLDDSALYAGKNLIINGAMQVAQRGTSITTDGYAALDRYYIYGDGTSTKTQESLSSGEPYNEGFRHFLRITNTSVSSLTGGYKSIYQPVEAQNVAQSGWNYTSSSSYITLSFWVRSSVSQEFFGSIQTHDGTTQKYPFSLGTLAADTWTKVTKTIPGNSNIQVDNDTGIGLFVNIAPFWGTNYTDSSVSVDTWAAYSGSTRFPDFTSTWGTTNNATFDVTGVQLEVGASASAFEHRSYGDELARCQRYFRRYCEGSSYKMSPCVFIGNTSTIAYGNMNLVPSMRDVPTSDFSNIRIDDQNSGQAVTSFSVSANSTNDSLYLTAQTASGLTQFRLYYIMANGTSSGRLDFSAEL